MHQINPLNATARLFGAFTLATLALLAFACDRDSPVLPSGEGTSITNSRPTTTGSVVFSAHATGVRSSVLGVTVGLCPAGPLPPQGGEDGEVVMNGRVPGVLQAMFFHSIVFGFGDLCRAQANSGDFDVTVAGQRIQGHLVAAGAEVKCVGGNLTFYAGSNVVDLRINGTPVTVTGQVNQTISLPLGLGRVVINEQMRTATSIRVRGLHIVVLGTADVTISEAQAGLTCGQPDCTPADCVTGCGSITTPAGSKASFAMSGGLRNGAAWGDLAYSDKSGPSVRATGVASYTVMTSTIRRMQGPCEVNGQAGFTYVVDVADDGNGTADMFRIQLSNGYSAHGVLRSGDIRLGIPCR